MLRLCAQQLSRRQRPPVQSVPTPYNNHMGNVCRKWRGKPLRREGLPVFSNCLWSGTAEPSPRSMWFTHVPSTIANGEHVFGCSLGHFPQSSTAMGEPAPATPHPTVSVAPAPNGDTVPLGRRLWDQLLLPKNLLIRREKGGSFLWGPKKTAGRPFVRTLI